MAPSTFPPDRAAFRQAVAGVAAKAKAMLPTQVNGRIEKAVKLVLQGDVQPEVDGTVTVYSATDATRRYVLQGHACTCADFERGQAPQGWCAHRIAAGIAKRVGELLPQSTGVETGEPVCHSGLAVSQTPPLPEAPASVNVHLTISGRQVQFTLRDSDEVRLLARLAEVLQRFPLPTGEASGQRQGKGWCSKHHVQMKLTQKDGRSWYAHRTAEGWCTGR